MNTKLKILTWLLLLGLLLVPTSSVAAQGSGEGKLVIAGTYTLNSGETLVGDLVVIGGAATIQESAVVEGEVVVMGGSLVVKGAITKDVLVMGGSIILGDTAYLHGDLTTMGVSLVRSESAVVEGEVYNSATSYGNGIGIPEDLPQIVTWPNFNLDFNPFLQLGGAFSNAIVIGLLAMLVAVLLPTHTRRVAQAALAQPAISGGLGLLTVAVLPVALVAMTITLILIPVALLVIIGVVVLLLYGWIALGTEVGVRLSKGNWSMPLAAGLGTFLLTLTASILTRIPGLSCLGWPAVILLYLIALGAVFMSRFGVQAVPGRNAPAVVAPVPAVPPVAVEAPVEPAPVVETPARKRKPKAE